MNRRFKRRLSKKIFERKLSRSLSLRVSFNSSSGHRATIFPASLRLHQNEMSSGFILKKEFNKTIIPFALVGYEWL